MFGPLDGMFRFMMRTGNLTVVDAAGVRHRYGDGSGPAVAFRITDRTTERRLFLRPALAIGEAYMDGTVVLESGTLVELLGVLMSNHDQLDRHPLHRFIAGAAVAVRRWHMHNPIHKSKANVAHHYDLSNAFYRLFLDEDMQYSCAYFERPAATLEDAQFAKKRHIAAKLQLQPGQRVLDIGSGWGGMAITLAQLADVEVVGVTLSVEQHRLATERASALGLSDRVRFELRDYREINERFDRIVSVGMFEHVGVNHYAAYFGAVRDRLTDNGVALIHSIGRRSPPGTTGKWLRKYIFPGGYSPALSETLAAVERSGLWSLDIEVLRLHYADTLAHWQARFQAARDRVADMYDERFCRMWEFYLAACEQVFRVGDCMVFQLQLARKRDAVPITRTYLYETEARLRRTPDTPIDRPAIAAAGR